MYSAEIIPVQKVLTLYFEGIFDGDVQKLKAIFHPNAMLFGDIEGHVFYKSLDDYLVTVKNRRSPSELEEKFEMEIIGIEIIGNDAIAKLHVPMLGYNYYDFLSLSKINNEWLIVNKLYTHVKQ